MKNPWIHERTCLLQLEILNQRYTQARAHPWVYLPFGCGHIARIHLACTIFTTIFVSKDVGLMLWIYSYSCIGIYLPQYRNSAYGVKLYPWVYFSVTATSYTSFSPRNFARFSSIHFNTAHESLTYAKRQPLNRNCTSQMQLTKCNRPPTFSTSGIYVYCQSYPWESGIYWIGKMCRDPFTFDGRILRECRWLPQWRIHIQIHALCFTRSYDFHIHRIPRTDMDRSCFDDVHNLRVLQ